VLTTLPSSNSLVSSPRYQTLPSPSWPVERVLDQLALLGHDVVDDKRLDPVHDLLPVGDGDHDPQVTVLAALAVDPAASRLHRPVRVVDLGRELVRVERDRLAALGKLASRSGVFAAPHGREQEQDCDGCANHAGHDKTAR
jgi:hypothetical protein